MAEDGADRGRREAGGPEATGSRVSRSGAALLWPIGRFAVSVFVVLAIWQAAVVVFRPPSFMLPAPLAVAEVAVAQAPRLLRDAAVTSVEILAGLAAGILFGVVAGIAMTASQTLSRILGPILVVSQALPVFAIAPLLVLWFGFGLASKVVMAMIIIFFPVASALADGLRRTDPGLLDLATLGRATRWQTLFLIRLPSALPSLATGVRVAAVFAPIGAVIGEWVGASAGLGLTMVEANARMRTDLLFAALALLALATLALRAAVDGLTRRMIPWAEDEH